MMIGNRIDPALKIPASTAGGLAIALLLLRFLPCLNSISSINPIRHYKQQLVLFVNMQLCRNALRH